MFSPGALWDWPMDQTRQFLADPLNSDQIRLNVLLFVPAGYFLARVRRRPVVCWALLLALSLGVEVLQAVLGVGANDISDVVANALGAGLGTAAAALVSWVRPGERRVAGRHVVGWCGAWLVVVILIVAAAQLLAEQRARHLQEVLTRTFAGSTLADYRRWESEDLVTARVFDVVSPRADGVEQQPDRVVVRYPASVLGAQRCALVTWRDGGVSTAVARGATCTRFLG
jgi:hypothetical protein